MSDKNLDRLFDIPDPFENVEPSDAQASRSAPRLPEMKSPTRIERERNIAMALVAAIVWQMVWVLVIEHRADFDTLDPSMIILGVGVPLYLSFGGLYVALRGGKHGLGVPVSRLAIIVTASPVLFAMEMWLLSSRMTDETAPFLGRALRCMAVTLALSAPLMAILALVLRRSFVTASIWRGAAIGVACGALGAATMTLACVHSEALHVIVAHGSMMIVGGIAGALVGRKLARA